MVYIMAVIYSLCILLYFFNFKSRIYYKILCAIVMFPVIFIDLVDMIRPGMYMDLVRIYGEMQTLNLYGWYGLNEEIYSEAILSKVYLYLIAITEIYRLLPIITTFLVYFLALYMVKKIGEYLNSSNKWINRAMLFTVLFIYYLNVSTNIRYTLSVTICFIIIIYDVFFQGKKYWCILGYIFSVLIHPAVAMIIFFRICANYSLKYFIIILSILAVVINFYLENIIQVLLTFNIDIITGIVFKINAYNEGDFQGFTNFYRLSVIVFDIVTILLGLIIIKYLKEEWYLFYRKILNLNIILGMVAFIAMLMDILYANRAETCMIYFYSIYIYIVQEKKYFKLTDVGYSNLKIIFYILLLITSIYFWYFNIYTQYNYYI